MKEKVYESLLKERFDEESVYKYMQDRTRKEDVAIYKSLKPLFVQLGYHFEKIKKLRTPSNNLVYVRNYCPELNVAVEVDKMGYNERAKKMKTLDIEAFKVSPDLFADSDKWNSYLKGLERKITAIARAHGKAVTDYSFLFDYPDVEHCCETCSYCKDDYTCALKKKLMDRCRDYVYAKDRDVAKQLEVRNRLHEVGYAPNLSQNKWLEAETYHPKCIMCKLYRIKHHTSRCMRNLGRTIDPFSLACRAYERNKMVVVDSSPSLSHFKSNVIHYRGSIIKIV